MTDNIQNIVVVGGDDNSSGSKFVSNVRPIKFDMKMGMAITSIYHGEIFNITNANNKIYVVEDVDVAVPPIPEVDGMDQADARYDLYPESVRQTIVIKQGRYKNVLSVVKVIAAAIKTKYRARRGSDARTIPGMQQVIGRGGNITISTTSLIILVDGVVNSPWGMLGIHYNIKPDNDVVLVSHKQLFNKRIEKNDDSSSGGDNCCSESGHAF